MINKINLCNTTFKQKQKIIKQLNNLLTYVPKFLRISVINAVQYPFPFLETQFPYVGTDKRIDVASEYNNENAFSSSKKLKD